MKITVVLYKSSDVSDLDSECTKVAEKDFYSTVTIDKLIEFAKAEIPDQDEIESLNRMHIYRYSF